MAIEISPNASVKLDGNGNGQVSLTPPAGTVWRLRLANVSTTGTVKQPQAFLYRGSTSGPVEQIDSTYLGNSASSAKVAGAPFYQGQVLWAKWVGGDAGATATLQAYGVQGRRGEAPFDEGGVGEGFPLNVATVFQAGNTVVINSSGLFVYSGAPALGNLIASIAPASGTDQYGNGFGAGFESYGSLGAAAQITAGTIGLFSGLSVISELTPQGFFLYSPSGGAGNLIAAIASAAGTDQYGNPYVQGMAEYTVVGGHTFALSMGNVAGQKAFFAQDLTSNANVAPQLQMFPAPGGCEAILFSGQGTSAAVGTQVVAEDSLASGVANGLISLVAGKVFIGAGFNAWWDDGAGQLKLPAGGGPFIDGEVFHALSNPAGITGTARVKKLPWNAIWYEGQVTWSGTTGTTLTFGSPPDASYNPLTSLHRPVGTNATPSAVSNTGRLFIPTSGGPQLVVPTVTGANTSWGWSLMIPTN